MSTETTYASRRRDRERELQLAAAAAVPSFDVCLYHANGLVLAMAEVLTPACSTAESRMLLMERIVVAVQATGAHMLETLKVERRARAGDADAQALVAAALLRMARTGRPL